MPEWFHRFGDIPGVKYTTPPDIDRTQLPGYDDVPQLRETRPQFQLPASLLWPAGNGRPRSSGSPAFHCKVDDSRETRAMPAAAVLRRVAEGLELPGIPSDYHFQIQHGIYALARRQRREPELIPDIERLCWLDIALVQARPDAASTVVNGQRRFYDIQAFRELIQIYETRGDLADALKVAELAVNFEL